MSANKVTSYKWKIADFHEQYLEAYNKRENLVSNAFSLVTRPSIQFTLFYNIPNSFYRSDNTYGVILKKCDMDQALNFDMKIWMEDDKGQRFGEYSVENHEFKTVGDRCEFNVKTTGNDWSLFSGVYGYANKSMFICCELLDLNPESALFENRDYEFLQNQWASYEEELHDAVIKVGQKEFKVSKIFFMSQSTVFKSMFMSKFKEGATSEIQVSDVDEGTMEHLVKWFYTGQIDEKSPVEKLYEAAEKYDVKILKEICVQRMTSTLTKSNAFSRLIISVKHSNEILKNASLEYLDKLSSRVDLINFFTSPQWIDLNIKNAMTAQEIADLLQKKMHR